MSGSLRVRRTTRRVVSTVAIVGLLAGMLAVPSGPAAATSLLVGVSSSVSGSTASITITVNRTPKAVSSCNAALDTGPTIDCGTPASSTKTSTTYGMVLTNLSSGSHTVVVSVKLTDRGAGRGSTSFDVVLSACNVTNRTTSVQYDGTGANLQTAIDAAGFADALDIRGLCIGNFRLTSKTLTLVGKATNAYPVATLDGNGAGHVVLLDFCPPPTFSCTTDITLTDLLITNGYFGGDTFNDVGGGIYNNHAILTLSGSTEVSGNHAAYGGGIASYGTVTLKDSARVVGNTATVAGGGIYILGAPLNACATWTGAISPNTPDDPPALTPIIC